MKFSVLTGSVALFLALVFGIRSSENGFDLSLLSSLINAPGIFITAGGTVLALTAAFPIRTFMYLPKHLKLLIRTRGKDPFRYVEVITALSGEARKKGLLSLESKAATFENEFLRESLLLAMDAAESDQIRAWSNQQISDYRRRDKEERRIYTLGAAFAMTFGITGTLIGLANIMKAMSLENAPGNLGASLSAALIVTFYGALLASCFFLPLAKGIEAVQERETHCNEMIVEGVIALKEGGNPEYIRKMLIRFLAEKEHRKDGRKAGKPHRMGTA